MDPELPIRDLCKFRGTWNGNLEREIDKFRSRTCEIRWREASSYGIELHEGNYEQWILQMHWILDGHQEGMWKRTVTMPGHRYLANHIESEEWKELDT